MTDLLWGKTIEEFSKEMDLKYGCEKMIDAAGKKWYRGASTDWCWFPAERFSIEQLNAAKESR